MTLWSPLPQVSRRVFLRALSASGSALTTWVACSGGPPLGSVPTAGVPANPEPQAESPVLPLPFLTPLDAFFVQAGGRATVTGWAMPQLDGASHQIVITGLVQNELHVSLKDLEGDTTHHVTVVKTLMCVLGFRACALWTGVPLRVLLERAGVDRERAVRVRFLGADTFENNLKWRDIAQSPTDMFEPLLVFRMNGAALPVEHGYPVRLLLADRYGYKNTKWLARIEVTDRDEATGQYQARGYPDSGKIEPPVPNVESHRITQDVPAGPCELYGYALSGAGAIEAVELQLDAAGFTRAAVVSTEVWRAQHPELERALQVQQPERFGAQWRGVWVVWRCRFELARGEHAIALRARDTTGQVGTATVLQLRAV